MKGEWQLRSATEHDLDAMLGIAQQSPSAPQWTRANYRQRLATETDAAQKWLTVIAEADGIAVGFVVASAICSVTPAEAELESVVVAQTRRGHGIGSALVDAAIAWSALQGAVCLRLEVRSGNSTALRLYCRKGFVTAGVRPGYYAAPVDDAVCMERNVK